MTYQTVVVPPSFQMRMIDHAMRDLPNECCGVLGGRNNIVSSVYRITNDMASMDAYKANEKELFDAIRKMREKGEDMVGLYHSHTGDKPDPSDRDKELNYFPNHFYFIISFPQEGEPTLHCYTMSEMGVFSPISII